MGAAHECRTPKREDALVSRGPFLVMLRFSAAMKCDAQPVSSNSQTLMMRLMAQPSLARVVAQSQTCPRQDMQVFFARSESG